MDETPEILPFQRLVCVAAGKAGRRAAQIFALDNACAHIARTVKEPIMAQIRLAWWRDGLTAERATAQHDAPDLIALREMEGFEQARADLVAMVDGWEELIIGGDGNNKDMLLNYASGRGAGLFGALAPEWAACSATTGRIWALWDLAGHLGDAALIAGTLRLAKDLAEGAETRALPRMLAMMAGPALADVRRGKGAPPVLTPGLYARMMRYQILGR